jgi:hypothetical protein
MDVSSQLLSMAKITSFIKQRYNQKISKNSKKAFPLANRPNAFALASVFAA